MHPNPRVIFEDSQILILDKPANLLSSKLNNQFSLEDILVAQYKVNLERGGLVHRLDKDTSGVLVVAKTENALSSLQEQFRGREVKKEYLALVHGLVSEPGLIDAPIDKNPNIHDQFIVGEKGRLAATKYEPIEQLVMSLEFIAETFAQLPKRDLAKLRTINYQLITLLKCFPLTGRTHQIRVHLKYINHPIVSDEQYVGRKMYKLDSVWCPRQFLHAAKIGFNHPESGDWVEFESSLPEDLENVLDKLKIKG